MENEQTNDGSKLGYLGKNNMIDLRNHDSLIKKFLSDRAVLKAISDSVKHDSSEVLLRYVISKEWFKSEPMQYKHISIATGLEISEIADTLKSDLNDSLGFISSKHNIDPPIQLYFRTKKHNVECNKITGNSNIGAHLACSVNKDKHISGTFIVDNKLKEILSGALEEIKQEQSKQPPKLKYLRNMKDVLKWEDEDDEAVWFRKSGPIAADFGAGYIYEREELRNELNELVTKNKVSILEGDGGHGKSVLVRSFAYNLFKNVNDTLVYHYSFKSDPPIVDFHDFLSILIDISGVVIVYVFSKNETKSSLI